VISPFRDGLTNPVSVDRAAGFLGLPQRNIRPVLRSAHKELIMSEDDSEERADGRSVVEILARRLAEQTGISEPDARLLIELIGTNSNSLVREARLLKSRR
jgi:hypothetical protein